MAIRQHHFDQPISHFLDLADDFEKTAPDDHVNGRARSWSFSWSKQWNRRDTKASGSVLFVNFARLWNFTTATRVFGRLLGRKEGNA